MHYPKGLEWVPNIHREDYRLNSMYGAIGRGENAPCVQELEKYGHIINLFSSVYDRGGKVVGMIEERLGDAAFFDFLHGIYARYGYRILRVADFQHELEAYTGQPWQEFFDHWLYAKGMTDWCVENVRVEEQDASGCRRMRWAPNFLSALRSGAGSDKQPCTVTVTLHQKADYDEETLPDSHSGLSRRSEPETRWAPRAGGVAARPPRARNRATSLPAGADRG
jgi:hypothetical protein